MIGRAAPQHDVLRWLPHFDVYRHSPIADRLDLARPGMADERGPEEAHAIKKDAARLFEVVRSRSPLRRTPSGGLLCPVAHSVARSACAGSRAVLTSSGAPGRAQRGFVHARACDGQGAHDRMASKLQAEAAELRSANAELHNKLVSAIAKSIQLQSEVGARRPARSACDG